MLKEFHTRALTKGAFISGSLDGVHSLLTEAFGREQATKLVDWLSKALADGDGHLDNLGKIEPQQLAKFVQDEHPQAIALMMAHLDPLRRRRSPHRPAIGSPAGSRDASRVARARVSRVGAHRRGGPAPEAEEHRRAVARGVRRCPQRWPTSSIVSTPRPAPSCSRGSKGRNPELFDNVRRFMFVFEDLLTVDKAALTTLFQQLDRQTIVTALKGS